MPSTTAITIFGASGDLAGLKLIPSLFRLDAGGYLPEGSFVVGVARSAFTDAAFRDDMEKKVKKAIDKMKEPWNPEAWAKFAAKLFYCPADSTKPEGMKVFHDWLKAKEKPGEKTNRLFYFSVSPTHYAAIAAALGAEGMNKEEIGFSRAVVEKPFGTDLASSKTVNGDIHKYFREEQIYRIDHYLGKDTVQNIFVLRFANTIFEQIWNSNFIDHVQITVAEQVDVAQRADYYDISGVLRDMFQSHILQVLTMVAMEAPAKFTADKVRNEKMKVLDAIKAPSIEEAKQWLAVGQYEGYSGHKGVKAGSRTPTYAAARFEIHNQRWRNVPFYLRSGKALKTRYSEVVIQFRCPPHMVFPLPPGEVLDCNRLTMILQPNEGIKITFQAKVPSVDHTEIKPRDLHFDYRTAFGDKTLPEAYERLILDAIQGEAALFMRSDEIERSWEIMDPYIAAADAADGPPMASYKIGSEGPDTGDKLLALEGRKWQKLPS